MDSLRDDYTAILAGAPRIRVDLTRTLLTAAGIPCLADAPDEMGVGDASGPVGNPYGDLYVPNQAVREATAILDDAWGPDWRSSM